jgi:hypothetical protein
MASEPQARRMTREPEPPTTTLSDRRPATATPPPGAPAAPAAAPAAKLPAGGAVSGLIPPREESRDAARTMADAARPESAPLTSAQQQADEPPATRRQQPARPQSDNLLRSARPAPAQGPPSSDVQGLTRPDPGVEARATIGARSARGDDLDAGSADWRLAGADRPTVEREITAFTARLGGAVVPTSVPSTVEITIPREAYPELTREIERHGTLRVIRQPDPLPATVRIGLTFTE